MMQERKLPVLQVVGLVTAMLFAFFTFVSARFIDVTIAEQARSRSMDHDLDIRVTRFEASHIEVLKQLEKLDNKLELLLKRQITGQ